MQSWTNITQYPSLMFSDFIDSYRIYSLEENGTFYMHPEGCMEIVFQIDGEFAQKPIADQSWKVRPRNFVGGLHSTSYHVKSLSNKGRLLGIKFKPYGARNFVPDKLNLYKNQIVGLEDLGIPGEFYVDENCPDEVVIKKAEAWLSILHREKDASIIDYAVNMLKASEGFTSITAVSQQLNISKSHLRLRFNEEVGMSPKEYSKILRFNAVLDTLGLKKEMDLTAIAHQLGYHDQSHFIKDFSSVSGTTPLRFLKLQK